jgi:hypothetical protein
MVPTRLRHSPAHLSVSDDIPKLLTHASGINRGGPYRLALMRGENVDQTQARAAGRSIKNNPLVAAGLVLQPARVSRAIHAFGGHVEPIFGDVCAPRPTWRSN